jgi:hypothetical protein
MEAFENTVQLHPGVNLESVLDLLTDRDQEGNGVDDSQIGYRPRDGVRTLRKLTVAEYEVVRLTFGGEIELRFVLWVARQSYVESDIVDADGGSFDSRDELGDYVICQLQDLGPC